MQASCSSSPLASSSSVTLNHSKNTSTQPCPRIDQSSSDVDLKRKYLALLPPTQIIDLCLAFEAQVPVHLQTALWPSDLDAAIVRLQEPPEKQDEQQEQPQKQPTVSPTPPPENSPSIAEVPFADHGQAMAALTDTANEQEPPITESNGEPKPSADADIVSISSSRTPSPAIPAASPAPVPTQTDPTPQSAHPAASPASSAHPGVSPVPVLSPVPTMPSAAAATPTSHSHYPHTHYSYTAAASAYPHAPYYSMPPPGAYYYAGGHYYPHYGHLPAAAHQPSINPQPSVPSSFYPSVPPSTQNHYGATTNGASSTGEDLPSYEEMLVEALTHCDEGEGCPPKALFLWMAAQYPLQVNFRPSASQALQKAHKRGRFGKNDAGKYFLQRDWEGGNTSRRTTRRPQTGGTSTTATNPNPSITSHASPPSRSSPFTTTPLVHTSPTFPHTQPASSTTTAAHPPPATANEEHVAEGSDAWEAAQNILKAINLAGLLSMPAEKTEVMATASAPPTADLPPPHPPESMHPPASGHPPSGPIAPMSGPLAPMSGPLDSNALGLGHGHGPGPGNGHGLGLADGNAFDRSALKGHLAMLASQLEVLMQEDDWEDHPPIASLQSFPTPPPSAHPEPQATAAHPKPHAAATHAEPYATPMYPETRATPMHPDAQDPPPPMFGAGVGFSQQSAEGNDVPPEDDDDDDDMEEVLVD